MRKKYRKNADGTFRGLASYRDKNGEWKQKTKGGFSTAKKAEQWAEEKEREMLNLVDQNISPSNATISDIFDLYIEQLEFLEKRPNTIAAYIKARKFFSELKKPVSKLTPYDIKRYYQLKVTQNGKYYDNYMKILKTVLNFAIRDLKYLSENPAKFIQTKKRTDTRELFVTEELYQKILSDCKNERVKIFIQNLRHLGARINEIVALTIFDMSPDFFTINKQYNTITKKNGPPKSDSGYRKIPVHKSLYQLNKTLPIMTDGRIFTIQDVNKTQKFLKKYNVTPHCFRHTRATQLLSEGIDQTTVAKVMGDKIETVIKHYIEYNKDKLEENYEKIRTVI